MAYYNRLNIENNRVVYHFSNSNEFLKGSSIFKNENGEMRSKKDVANEKRERKDGEEINCLEVLGAEKTAKIYHPLKRSAKSGEYKLNKQKVRGKISAFFALKQSQKFSAFYSISFPSCIEQAEAVKAFNTWRTRLSKLGLKTFIRICEFQKNGTLHFHMLTNNFLNIRTVNYMMAKVLENMGVLKRANISLLKYNGVDVKHIRNGKNLGAYVTKYVSKNTEKFDVLPYHCSRDISALFYMLSIPTSTKNIDYKVTYSDVQRALKQTTTFVLENDFAMIEYYGKDKKGSLMHSPSYLMNPMTTENQLIYDMLMKYDNFKPIGVQENTLKN